MPIAAVDIQFRLTGGAANANVNASLGGAMSSTGITDAVDNNLFDDVSGAESTSGHIDHRCICIRNNDGTRTLADARIYISVATTSTSTELDIGVAAEAVSVQPATIANELAVPGSVTFSRPSTYAAGLQLNAATGLAPSAYRGVWVRRTVDAGATATAADTGTLKVEGDSPA